MFQKFYPDLYVSSTYEIDFDRLYRSGYRGLIFDIDNTLVTHGAPANDQAKQLFAHLHEIGFATCLISNNQGAAGKNHLRMLCILCIFMMRISHQQKIMRKLWSRCIRRRAIRFLSEIRCLPMCLVPIGQEFHP